MALMPEDNVEVNKHNTALRLTSPSQGIGDFSALFPTLVAVEGDAESVAIAAKKQQTRNMHRKYLRNTAIVLGIQLAILLIFMIQNQDFNPVNYVDPWLWFMAFFAIFLPLMLTSGEAEVEGVHIHESVYPYLTPEDRDGLFRAFAESPTVYSAAMDLLTEKYAAQEKMRNKELLDHDRKIAATLLIPAKAITAAIKKES